MTDDFESSSSTGNIVPPSQSSTNMVESFSGSVSAGSGATDNLVQTSNAPLTTNGTN